MTSQMNNEMIDKITERLGKMNYILALDGDKNTIQIVLKTAFEKEIVNRVYEIKGVILSINPDFDIDKKISVDEVMCNSVKHKAILIKYD